VASRQKTTCTKDVPQEFLEKQETGFGELIAVRHCASIQGVEGWLGHHAETSRL
jgi:predicted thioesterase